MIDWRALWGSHYTYGGVSAAVVEEPFVLEADEAFGEGGSGFVLARFFVGALWFEYGVLGAGDEMSWIGCAEEGFAGSVGVGTKGWVAVRGVVFAVVEDDDSGVCEDRGWAGFGKAAVEVTGALGEDFGGIAGGVFYGHPVDEIRRGGEVDGPFAPVHPVFTLDAGCDEVTVFEMGDDSAGLVFESVVFAVGGSEESWAVFGPVVEVG